MQFFVGAGDGNRMNFKKRVRAINGVTANRPLSLLSGRKGADPARVENLASLPPAEAGMIGHRTARAALLPATGAETACLIA